MKGITVMMLGFIIGITLLVVFMIFVLIFYDSPTWTSIMDGLRDAFIPLA